MLILKFVAIKISCSKIKFILKERSLGKMENLIFSEKNSIALGQFCSLIFEMQKLFFQCIEFFLVGESHMKSFKDGWNTRTVPPLPFYPNKAVHCSCSIC